MRYRNLIVVVILLIIITILWIINLSKVNKEEILFGEKTNIRIGGTECFRLLDNDSILDLKNKDTSTTKAINKDYWYLYIRESDQVLNQVIKGETDFYIWLSFLTPSEFARKQNADTSLNKIYTKNYIHGKRKFNSFFMKRKDKFISRTLFVADAGNTIIIDNIGLDSNIINILYKDTNAIPQRLCNN